MPVFDLTHKLREGMTIYPGTEPPEILCVNTLSENGFREKKFTISSHTGTHIDAPAHMLPDGQTLDQFPIDTFTGPACVYLHSASEGRSITCENLAPLHSLLQGSEFLLIGTGWDRYWGDRRYLEGFPTMTTEAAEWVTQFGLKGIGIDTISVDALDSTQFPIHMTLFGHDMLIIENLTHLHSIGHELCEFTCLPLKLTDGDGAPARAMARIAPIFSHT